MKYLGIAFAALGLMSALPVSAQTLPQTPDEQEPQPLPQLQPLEIRPIQPGRVADSAVGEVGQRDIRGRAPTARIASRIQNRVASRVRNRLDRNYDSRGNAIDSIAEAEDQARLAGRSGR